ncbi:MAG: DUF3747 domain-containing protein [Leptolyngbyaceae bacterium]|nr:DUF3747 domain-containing protein [Leptolyngbyaceae bacterium]
MTLRRRITAIAFTAAAATMGALGFMEAGSTATFGQADVDQDNFVAIAAPRGQFDHQLLVVEQVSSSRDCWSETGAAPTIVDPLLVNFDFTGICGRSTDSNGYSIRVDGQDLALRYSLRVVERDNDLVLIGAPDDSNAEELIIGRANGTTDGFARLNLDPGWKFTKRTYNNQVLGHVYLTYDSNLPTVPDSDNNNTPDNVADSFSFPDIKGDIYAQDIEAAVDLGFIAGFHEDNTFRPRQSLTREQIVSMVLGALDEMPNVDLDIPTAVTGNPYPDVVGSRWSAAKIQFAKDNNIISGYQDGNFRPSQEVTRAELMAILRRAAEYGKSIQSSDSTLWPQQEAFSFADTANHWASPVINQMSSYCGVASPLNETGRNFQPDTTAQRNYAAAATLRMLNCVNGNEANETEVAATNN